MGQVVLTSGVTIQDQALCNNIKRVINQIYKLLPLKEQGKNWQKSLETVLEQLYGMKDLIKGQDQIFFRILCKLKGLLQLDIELQYYSYIYRNVIFECLNLLTSVKENVGKS